MSARPPKHRDLFPPNERDLAFMRKVLERQPLLISPKRAAELLDIGRQRVYELIESGELGSVRLGVRTVRIPRQGLERLLGISDPPAPVDASDRARRPRRGGSSA